MPELVLAGVLATLFLLPLLTAYMAYSHNRRFWVWFAVGCGLPYASLFVVMFVVRRDRQRAAAADAVLTTA